MSIQITSLTRLYGTQKAVDNVSFSVSEGQIVGFLGPNGAGKSTTMKIITGFLPASEGSVSVCGTDVSSQPMVVKQITGYLPEHNPLYHDMYVHEYLDFVAGIYGLTKAKRQARKEELIQLCGLSVEQNKKIGSLSKGYRQRVGLAQALMHDPRVLVLDEPTSGLDPNQLIEIRKLIKDVSKNKTVLFSSHILQEVEALCDRVVVINKGKIVADDLLTRLLQGEHSLVVEFDSTVSEEELMQVPGIERVQSLGQSRFRVFPISNQDVRQALVQFSSQHNKPLLELKREEGSLESVFNQLTQGPAAVA